MAVLIVTADEDYRDNVPSVANTIAITFATTAISSTARFDSIQFGAAFISDTVAIIGDANFNTIAVHTPSDAVFSAAGWTFTSGQPTTRSVAQYDSAVSEWLFSQFTPEAQKRRRGQLTVPMELVETLRYGENPHQSAAFYRDRSLAEHGRGGIATAVQHHGKEMSYNNYLDADAAWNAVNDFPGPTLRHREAHEPLRRRHARRPARSLPARRPRRCHQRLRRHRRLQPDGR